MCDFSKGTDEVSKKTAERRERTPEEKGVKLFRQMEPAVLAQQTEGLWLGRSDDVRQVSEGLALTTRTP